MEWNIAKVLSHGVMPEEAQEVIVGADDPLSAAH